MQHIQHKGGLCQEREKTISFCGTFHTWFLAESTQPQAQDKPHYDERLDCIGIFIIGTIADINKDGQNKQGRSDLRIDLIVNIISKKAHPKDEPEAAASPSQNVFRGYPKEKTQQYDPLQINRLLFFYDQIKSGEREV